MTKRQSEALPAASAEAPPPAGVRFRTIGGTGSTEFNASLWRRTSETAYKWPTNDAELSASNEKHAVAMTAEALKAFEPADGVEGMLASQAVALHFASIECLRRAMIPSQPTDVASRLRKDGANLARAMMDMVDALDRKRGKSPQVVRVERVVVQDGGQAIVGSVGGSGGNRG